MKRKNLPRCIRCGKKGYAKWNICADKNRKRALCKECDILINTVVSLIVFGGGHKTWRRISRYITKLGKT
jgi:hypothetical protein